MDFVPTPYSFCGICGNEMEGLTLITRGRKSLFPHWPALHHLFCYCLYWCGDTWKEHLSFMFVLVLLWSGIYSGLCTGTQVTNVPPSGLSLGGILEGYSAPWVASEASKVLLVRNWTSVRDVIRSTPGASPTCLSGRTGRDEYGIRIGKGQTESDQRRKALV